jgi:hypothetical protein
LTPVLLFSQKRLPIDPNFNTENFVKSCPLNLSGADFYSITKKARQNALKRLIRSIESGEMSQESLTDDLIVLNEIDFDQALVGFQPTLSESSLLDYEKYFLSFSNKQ